MKIDAATDLALSQLRTTMAKASGDELAVPEAFIDQIGSEVDGWEDRVQEIKRDLEE